ncbi:hypothetical protein B1no1_08980 [Thermolongibacillus altinsuensis]|jgi:hypothetical protein|nr:hypothetical protein B1no1_08980 [Thermolongibacillus altinsuensis]
MYDERQVAFYRCTWAHGAGGKANRRLIEGVRVPYLMNDTLT